MDPNKETILLIRNNGADCASIKFAVFGNTAKEAYAKLDELNADIDPSLIIEVQDGRLFDYYMVECKLASTADKIDKSTALKRMLEISHNEDPRGRHEEADWLMCQILRTEHPELVQIFEFMEKWYA